MPVLCIKVNETRINSMSFDHKFDGFGVPCKRCGAKNAGNRLSGDMPPGIPGTYCDDCHKIVCKKASAYYKKQLEKSTRNLKTTVLFRKQSKWSVHEIELLTDSFSAGVWSHCDHPNHLVMEGHHSDKSISKALRGVPPYKITRVVGTKKEHLPFIPL